jgi:CRISPR-associated protein Cas2
MNRKIVKKKSGKKWYMLAYDIREPKRLRRVHYFIKKHGTALQKSVFLLQVDTTRLQEIISEIQSRVKDREDDVRIYPLRNPGSIWAAGQQEEKLRHLYAAVPKQDVSSLVGRFIRKLFVRKKS